MTLTPDPVAIVFVAIAGAVFAVDRATVRAYISAPIVSASLISALLGLPWLGLLTGLLFQLLWMNESETVQKFSPDAGFAAAIAAAISSSLVGPLAFGERLFTLWPYAIFFAILVAPLAGYGRWMVAKFLATRQWQYDQAVVQRDKSAIRNFLLAGLFAHALVGAILAAACYTAGYAGWFLFQSIWIDQNPILLLLIPLIAGIGLAGAARIFLQRDSLVAFASSALVVAIFASILRSQAIR